MEDITNSQGQPVHCEAGELEVLDLVVIEVYVKEGRPIPHARQYEIRIDDDPYRVDSPTRTGEDLLKLRGLCSCSHEVEQLFRHKDAVRIRPDEVIDLRTAGVERFVTVHKDEVTVYVNYADRSIPVCVHRGAVLVSAIRSGAGVPQEYILFSDATGQPLQDDGSVQVSGCEVFNTQVRGGASS